MKATPTIEGLHMNRVFFEEDFAVAENHQAILGPIPDAEDYAAKRAEMLTRRPGLMKASAMTSIESLIGVTFIEPLLSYKQEQHLFRKMNFAKWMFERTYVEKIKEPKKKERKSKGRKVEKWVEWHKHAVSARNHLMYANVRLCVGIAKRLNTQDVETCASELFAHLHKVIEYFDYTRSSENSQNGRNKFSTYATWALRKHWWRIHNDMAKEAARRSPVSVEEVDIFAPEDKETELAQREDLIKATVYRSLRALSDKREREIIIRRFGLGCKPLTLKEVGVLIGVTKERVRQIETRAMNRLRNMPDVEKVLEGV